MSQATANTGIKAEVTVAVRRKGEEEFTVIETKQLAPWQAKLMAMMKGKFDGSGNIR